MKFKTIKQRGIKILASIPPPFCFLFFFKIAFTDNSSKNRQLTLLQTKKLYLHERLNLSQKFLEDRINGTFYRQTDIKTTSDKFPRFDRSKSSIVHSVACLRPIPIVPGVVTHITAEGCELCTRSQDMPVNGWMQTRCHYRHFIGRSIFRNYWSIIVRSK